MPSRDSTQIMLNADDHLAVSHEIGRTVRGVPKIASHVDGWSEQPMAAGAIEFTSKVTWNSCRVADRGDSTN